MPRLVKVVKAPPIRFTTASCLACLLQELDKLQSSAKQEVATAQAKVGLLMVLHSQIAMFSLPDTAGFHGISST